MTQNSLDAIKKLADAGNTLVSVASKIVDEGWVHKAEPVNFEGEKGLLVWDYIFWNDIYFVSLKNKEKHTLFSHFSDREIEKKFSELTAKYGLVSQKDT